MIWDRIDKGLEHALAHDGTHDVRDVLQRIERGEAQWWGAADGVAITEVYCYPRKNFLNIWLVTGELDACLALEPEIEAYARERGCTELRTMSTRPGWLPIGKGRGWHEHSHQWVRALT